MLKQHIRSQYLSKRKAIPETQLRALNHAINNKLNQFNWSLYKTISLFLPIKKLNEVNTLLVLSFFEANFPEMIVAIPKTNFANYTLQHIQYSQNTILVQNKYHIPEPLNGNIILPSAIDVVFVPLLAFDNVGNRVGYGKGVYDKFLATCRSDVVKIGLSFFDTLQSIDDVNSFDIPLNYCITPNKVYRF